MVRAMSRARVMGDRLQHSRGPVSPVLPHHAPVAVPAPALAPARVPPVAAPIPLRPCPPDSPRFPRTRGKVRPRAIAWFGFSSFWGPLRHLLASAIATDSVDSRQWMVPEAPAELLGRIAAVLGPRGGRDAPTLAASMGGEVW